MRSRRLRVPSAPFRRPSRSRLVLAALLAALTAVPPAALAAPRAVRSAAPPLARHRLAGHVVPAVRHATRIDAGDRSADALTLTFVLTRSDQPAFERWLAGLYDPGAAHYRHFLGQRAIADRFGPSPTSYDRLLAYLGAEGFVLVAGSENRLTLTVRGTRAAAERALDVHLEDYETGGTRFFANDREPALPADLAPLVHSIAGLASLASVRVHHGPSSSAAEGQRRCATQNDSTLSDSANAARQTSCTLGYILPMALYNILCIFGGFLSEALQGRIGCLLPFVPDSTPIRTPGPQSTPGGSSQDGTAARALPLAPPPQVPSGLGQKIGIVAFDSFRISDVADFLALVGLPPERIDQVHEVKLNGGAALGANQSEVLLDVDTILMVAPGADVTVYSAPFTGPNVSFQTIFNRMLDDGMTIISNSWAYCENQTTLADVQSIDVIFQNAAAAGVSVFNASGDTGSTCLNGSPNTVAVPAGAPHATAVGGSSMTAGPGGTWLDETWWDGAAATPPTGQGGFGTSRFFARPFYQEGVSAHAKRSVPDVVVNADPAANGVPICQADAGGCPTPLVYGGTSIGAPLWAAFTALLNEAQGANFGFLNPYLYALADSDAFHDAADLHSDFAHVGLGSPNLSNLRLALIGATPGVPTAAQSYVTAIRSEVPADGLESTSIVVQLRDARGSSVSGKTVALAAQPSANVTITPAGGVSTVENGAVVFTVTNTVSEAVTFSATDTTDGVVVTETATVTFTVPPAASAGIMGFPLSLPADGTTAATITVTLQDVLGRPTPGKKVSLRQGSGHAIVTAPNPSVTGANGQIQFTVTNQVSETVTFTAVVESDGDLPVPGGVTIAFTGAGTSCVAPAPIGQNGFIVTPFATGFVAQNFFHGSVNWGACPGASAPAFLGPDVFITDFPNGKLFRLGAGGGAVSSADVLATHFPSFGFPAIGKDGRLYATFGATTGDFTTGSVVELDPVTGAIVRTVAAGQRCPSGLAVDPLSGDLFFAHQCFGFGVDDPAVHRVRDPGGANPTVEVYATLPGTPNGVVAFAPDGTLFAPTQYTATTPAVLRIDGTDVPGPPTVTPIAGVSSIFFVTVGAADTDGAATSLLLLTAAGMELVDLTTATPTVTLIAKNLNPGIIGPDGCLYSGSQDTVYKTTRTDGSCDFAPSSALPSLTLAPGTVAPEPAQGTTHALTAAFRNLNVPVDTPVFFTVTGANPSVEMVRTDASGTAVLHATAQFTGRDEIVATATVGGDTFTSNVATVTWSAGKHTTFLTLNTSPTGGVPGALVPVVASVVDSSLVPPAPVVGATVTFTLGDDQCTATTDTDGRARCFVMPADIGTGTLRADFTGDAALLASSDVRAFVTGGEAPLGTFVLHRATTTKGTAKFVKLSAIAIADDFGTGEYDVLKPTHLGAPVSTNGGPLSDPLTHLEAYALKRGKAGGPFGPRRDVHVSNQCDDAVVTLAKPATGLLPTATLAPNPDHDVDHFLCYRAKRQKKRGDGTPVAPFPKGVQVDVADELGTQRYDLKKLALVCTPAATSGAPALLAGPNKGAPAPFAPAMVRNPAERLLCYGAKLATKRVEQTGCGPADPRAKGVKITPGQPPVARRTLPVTNALGTASLDVTKPAFVCLPSLEQ